MKYSKIKNDDELIVRLPNWLGDTIMSLPALFALQQQGITLHLVGKPWIQDLLSQTQMPIYPMKGSLWHNRQMLASIPANKMLLLTNSFSSALMGKCGGKKTIGYRNEGRELLLTQSLTKPSQLHEVEYFWNIARFAFKYWYPGGSFPTSIPDKINLPLNPFVLNKIKKTLNLASINKPFWVVCPFAVGTGEGGQSKIWPEWQNLSRHLASRGIQTIVCPSKTEESLCQELVPNAQIIKGLNLSEYHALLNEAKFILANDSGPMHLAAATNTKTLGLFGVTSPLRTRPWGTDYLGELGRWPTLEEVIDAVDYYA